MLTLLSLDAETRKYMLDEMALDIGDRKLYMSERLASRAREKYPELLREAIISHNEDWLASQLRLHGGTIAMESYTRNGKSFERKVPVNAIEMLAEGEFNRFYLRGLCRRAIANREGPLAIYRAKSVSQPRAESERKIGTTVEPEPLLRDLREHIGVDLALGVPPGPNSGLSAKLETKVERPAEPPAPMPAVAKE
jgi:hypothetical protein